ncbi:MAG: hypothetical protein WA005_19790 [Candidatus Binataceae bacterium]
MKRDFALFKAQGRLNLLDDSEFREQSLTEYLAEPERPRSHYRPLSLVDRVIRRVLSDLTLDVLLTFNVRDFVDVCRRCRVQIAPQ